MLEKISHIRNPLTVIAMFAGLAEISGTVVLPFLQQPLQTTYVWFLMTFPFMLVCAFFITLNFNRKALYAPSDFRDDTHFVTLSEDKRRTPRPYDPSPLNQPLVVASLKAHVDTGTIEEAYRTIEAVTDLTVKADQYKEMWKMCLDKRDITNSLYCGRKYHELRGEAPDAYRLLSYTHWWFNEIDAAITNCNMALKLAIDHGDDDEMRYAHNGLAFYYAAKGINKDKAFSYIKEAVGRTDEKHPTYPFMADTYGYVYLKFGKTKEDIDEALDWFTKALKILPTRESFLDHFKECLYKKNALSS